MECHLYTTTSIKTKDHLHFKKRHGKKKFNAKRHFSLQYYGKEVQETHRAHFEAGVWACDALPLRSSGTAGPLDPPLAEQFQSRPLHAPVSFLWEPEAITLVPPSRNTSWRENASSVSSLLSSSSSSESSSPFSGPQGRLAWNSKGFSAAAIASEARAQDP